MNLLKEANMLMAPQQMAKQQIDKQRQRAGMMQMQQLQGTGGMLPGSPQPPKTSPTGGFGSGGYQGAANALGPPVTHGKLGNGPGVNAMAGNQTAGGVKVGAIDGVELPPDVDREFVRSVLPYLLAGGVASGGMMGAGLGGAAGAVAGHERGNMPEGVGRGVIRGGAAGAGAMAGSMLGSLAGNQFGAPGVGSLAGAGLGGMAGYLGSGAMIGDPVGGKRKKMEADANALFA
jgi:hypothetical protein